MGREYLLLIGSGDRPEFRAILRRLETLADWECRRFPTLDSAGRLDEGTARLAVLLESRPGEYPPRAVDRFRARFGPAPIVMIAGSLCEGEARTGRLPRGILRYYHYEWETALRPDLERFLNRRPGRLSLPATANEEDYWRTLPPPADRPEETVRIDSGNPAGENAPRCAVVAADPGMRELLAGNLARRFGMTQSFRSAAELLAARRMPQLERIAIDLILPRTLDFVPVLQQIAEIYPRAEYTLYLFAPHPEEIEAFTGAAPGVTVLSKLSAAALYDD